MFKATFQDLAGNVVKPYRRKGFKVRRGNLGSRRYPLPPMSPFAATERAKIHNAYVVFRGEDMPHCVFTVTARGVTEFLYANPRWKLPEKNLG